MQGKYDVFIFQDRKAAGVKSEAMVDFHYEYAKNFKMRVPLHPKNLF